MTTGLEQALQAALAPRDLLTHPFYQAWSAGELRAGIRGSRPSAAVPASSRSGIWTARPIRLLHRWR